MMLLVPPLIACLEPSHDQLAGPLSFAFSSPDWDLHTLRECLFARSCTNYVQAHSRSYRVYVLVAHFIIQHHHRHHHHHQHRHRHRHQHRHHRHHRFRRLRLHRLSIRSHYRLHHRRHPRRSIPAKRMVSKRDWSALRFLVGCRSFLSCHRSLLFECYLNYWWGLRAVNRRC